MVFTWYVRKIASAKGWMQVPKSDRHMHTMPVPRLGGVAIYLSFTTVVILATVIPRLFGIASPLDAKAMVGLLGPALVVFLLGLFEICRPDRGRDLALCRRIWDSQFGANLWRASAWLGLLFAANDIVGAADYKRVQSD
jgi:UDP-N-acetylmuramyl pentapeptide phosphotransferase/UDP-N-acetylglucosamine-1-phosphate transferase